MLERSLVYGGSTSCGCLRKERAEKANSPDLTGRQFGDLQVLQKLERAENGAARWLCKCSCGAECIVLGTLLTTGRRTRCSGKLHQKNYAYADIRGQKFDRLTAMYPTGKSDRNGSAIWHCRCDCGNELDIAYNVLKYANQKSCGCQKKEHNQKLRSYLTHVAGTSVDMLKSKKVPKDNTTGFKGVYLVRGKYMAKIVFQKKQYFLGTYDTIEAAAEARKEAEEILFDGVAEHYTRWKVRASLDPRWAEENPVQIIIDQDSEKRLLVTMLPSIEML